MTGDREQVGDDPSHELPAAPPVLELPSGVSLMPSNLGWTLFPPEGFPAAPETESRLPVAPEREPRTGVPDSATLQSLFGERPAEPLHDPQMLLNADEHDRLLRELVRPWLWEKSPFPSIVVLLDGDQHLPPDFNPRSVHDAWFSGQENAVILLYYLGRPDRTTAVFSAAAMEKWPQNTLRDLMDNSVREAGVVHAPSEQLARFCYRTVSRLDALHRRGPPKIPVPPSPAPVASAPVRVWPWLAGITAAAAALVALLKLRPRREVDDGQPIFLPDRDFYQRLGAPHCGGCCSLLQYERKD